MDNPPLKTDKSRSIVEPLFPTPEKQDMVMIISWTIWTDDFALSSSRTVATEAQNGVQARKSPKRLINKDQSVFADDDAPEKWIRPVAPFATDDSQSESDHHDDSDGKRRRTDRDGWRTDDGLTKHTFFALNTV